MSVLNVDITIPMSSIREAEVVYQVLRVDKEPARSGVVKKLIQNDNLLEVSFSGTEARKLRVGVTSFFDSLILVIETVKLLGPPEPTYDHYY